MSQAVFVMAIAKTPTGTVVTAANGGESGPPFVQFRIPADDVSSCFIGKRYRLTIEPWEDT